MSLIKDFGKVKVYHAKDHYEINVNGKFEVSCDNWHEVSEELGRIFNELNREA
jgi:hypothetical protein